MTPEELKMARRQLGLNMTQMAMQLKTARPTYRDWEHGVNRIPGICEVAVQGLLAKDQRFVEGMKKRLTKNSEMICQTPSLNSC